VQRRATNTGVVMVADQKIAFGRIHAGQVVTVHVAAEMVTIDLGEDTRTVRRTSTQPVRSIKAHRPRKPPMAEPRPHRQQAGQQRLLRQQDAGGGLIPARCSARAIKVALALS
jgi:hypothetical protein